MKCLKLIIIFIIIHLNLSGQNLCFEYLPKNVSPKVQYESIENNLGIYTFQFNVQDLNESIEIIWRIPAKDMYFYWTTKSSGGLKADWGSSLVQSHATSQSPVVTILNNTNQNQLTFAASDALNSLQFNSGVKEENGMIINKISIDPESFEGLSIYEIKLRIDQRSIPFWDVLSNVSDWWASFDDYKPMMVPEAARQPMYSTWYSFHQQLETEELIQECKIAKTLGCKAVIVDDGWQTLDNNRGYKYTGDWKPERIPQMKALVDSIHAVGMKFILWYSVPFVGSESEAFELFEGKFIDSNERRGSYVLDPRYPEVREYLIKTYVKAMKDWGLDGFKLDFVDNFRTHKDNNKRREGMDYANVNKASNRLFTDISTALKSINEDVLIEFRQGYIGPLMRKYGNMFRASDCPYSILNNRIRTTKIRLLAGNTATHSDMIMWHPDEPKENAALQLLNVMFSVPQISVKMHKYPKEHMEMLKFWISFWVKNRDVLIDGKFEAHLPNLNYPVLIGKTGNKFVAGVYSPNVVVSINSEKKDISEIYVINASGEEGIVLKSFQQAKNYSFLIYDCSGKILEKGKIKLDGLMNFKIPKAGLLQLNKF